VIERQGASSQTSRGHLVDLDRIAGIPWAQGPRRQFLQSSYSEPEELQEQRNGWSGASTRDTGGKMQKKHLWRTAGSDRPPKTGVGFVHPGASPSGSLKWQVIHLLPLIQVT